MIKRFITVKNSAVFLVLFFSLFVAHVAQADDGGPNTDFWVKDNKVVCLTIDNLDSLPADEFLVFDYSIDAGKRLGKPWAVVESGKCYQLGGDNAGSNLSVVKIVDGNEKEILKNYQAFDPELNIMSSGQSKLDPENYFATTLTQKDGQVFKIKAFNRIYFLGEMSVTSREEDFIHYAFTANHVFPTKYDFGDPITNFNVMDSVFSEGKDPLTQNPTFVSIKEKYTDLAKSLNEAIASCDKRKRIEFRYRVGDYESKIIWQLNDGSTFTPSRQYVPLKEIEAIGCKSTFIDFIKSHKNEFVEIDLLATKLKPVLVEKSKDYIKKHPEYLEYVNIPTVTPFDSIVVNRDEKAINAILDFVAGGEAQKVLLPGYYEEEPEPNLVKAEDHSPSVLDEPTEEKKTELVVNSTNPFMRGYILLPIFALVCFAAFFLKKKSK